MSQYMSHSKLFPVLSALLALLIVAPEPARESPSKLAAPNPPAKTKPADEKQKQRTASTVEPSGPRAS